VALVTMVGRFERRWQTCAGAYGSAAVSDFRRGAQTASYRFRTRRRRTSGYAASRGYARVPQGRSLRGCTSTTNPGHHFEPAHTHSGGHTLGKRDLGARPLFDDGGLCASVFRARAAGPRRALSGPSVDEPPLITQLVHSPHQPA
jgi:hypothetical protein